MKALLTASVVVGLSVGLPLPLVADDSSAWLQSAFETHCIKCHGKVKKIEGNVNLLAWKPAAGLQVRPELLEDLITVL